MSDLNQELPQNPEAAIRNEVEKTRAEGVQLMDLMEEAAKERGEFFIKFGDKNGKDREGNKVDTRVLLLKKGAKLNDLGQPHTYIQVAITREGPKIVTEAGSGSVDSPNRNVSYPELSGFFPGETSFRFGHSGNNGRELIDIGRWHESTQAMWTNNPAEIEQNEQKIQKVVRQIIKDNLTTPPPEPSPNQVLRTTIQNEQNKQQMMGDFQGFLNKTSQPKPIPQ